MKKTLEREINQENTFDQAISIIKMDENDRTGDGNLKPEAKDKARKAIEKYICESGRVNVSEIARCLGLSRPTARNLIDEVLAELQGEIENQAVAAYKWREHIAKLIDAYPGKFDKDVIALIRLKSSLLDKMQILRKALVKGDG